MSRPMNAKSTMFETILGHEIDERRRGYAYFGLLSLAVFIVLMALFVAL